MYFAMVICADKFKKYREIKEIYRIILDTNLGFPYNIRQVFDRQRAVYQIFGASRPSSRQRPLHYGASVNRGIRESFRLISISFTRFKFNRFLRSNTSFLMRQTSRF